MLLQLGSTWISRIEASNWLRLSIKLLNKEVKVYIAFIQNDNLSLIQWRPGRG